MTTKTDLITQIRARKDADLRGADLRGADLRGAYLRGAYLRGAYLRDADLRGADLRGAYLRGAYLRGAYLRDADLRGADLGDAALSECRGLVWAQSGPCGIGPRTLTATWRGPEAGIQIDAGCFHGAPDELIKRVEAGGWNWPEKDQARLAESVRTHLDRVVADVTRWLDAIEA